MTPMGTRSKYDLATTSRRENRRRGKARRARARHAARVAIRAEVGQ